MPLLDPNHIFECEYAGFTFSLYLRRQVGAAREFTFLKPSEADELTKVSIWIPKSITTRDGNLLFIPDWFWGKEENQERLKDAGYEI